MQTNEMIDGNWYYVQTIYPWYIKFKNFSDGGMKCYDHICYRTKEYCSYSSFGTTPTQIRLVDISEIYER